jgi:uncharacterized membrane protein YeaQ/YmgE (transglycosylase-associated protein family)
METGQVICSMVHCFGARFILTTILGIVGAFVAAYLGQAPGWYRPGEGTGLIDGHRAACLRLCGRHTTARNLRSHLRGALRTSLQIHVITTTATLARLGRPHFGGGCLGGIHANLLHPIQGFGTFVADFCDHGI